MVVLVGANQNRLACINVTHAEGAAAHTTLTCIVPKGRQSRQILLSTASGIIDETGTPVMLYYKSCSPGYYQNPSMNTTNQTDCLLCPPGTHRSNISAHIASTVCFSCPPGSEPNKNQTNCDRCEPNHKSNGTSCTACSKGRVSPKGSSECDQMPCPTFSMLNSDTSTCECKPVTKT